MRFTEMMELEQHGPDTYVGAGPAYPWGGLYGGQIVAQSLRAAAATVDAAYRVHSLHAYFIRRGDHAQPIRFEVDRLRDGRSFVTRAVVARQSMGAILNMSASFQLDQPTEGVQTATAPEVPGPDEVEAQGWSSMFERRQLSTEPGRAAGWFRVPDLHPAPGAAGVTDDPVLTACALAYVSDDLPADAVVSLRRKTLPGHEWFGISLDHAIWFQRRVPAGEWQLHEVRCDGLQPPRGLSVAHVFSTDGDHMATVTQEVLVREQPGSSPAPVSG
jgi:acyl-CoA thioesterase II